MRTRKDERLELRLTTAMLERVDDWRRREKDIPTRSEAIRRMVERVLDEDRIPSPPGDAA